MATTPRRVRIDDDTWADLEIQAPDGNRSAVINQMIDWYLWKPGAMFPRRACDGHDPTEKAVAQFLDWYHRKPGADLPDRPAKS